MDLLKSNVAEVIKKNKDGGNFTFFVLFSLTAS
jgi:hypothetical protein